MKMFGVRLNGEIASALEQEALRRGVKPTSAARELLIEALSGAHARSASERLEAIEALLGRLERALLESRDPSAVNADNALSGASEEADGRPTQQSQSTGSLAAWVNGA